MKIQIIDHVKCDMFTTLFQHMKTFTDLLNITFTETEMFIQSMDDGRVLVFEIHLPKEWFDVYEIGYGSKTLGISATIFFKMLNMRDKSQEILLSTDDNDAHNSSVLTVQLHKSTNKSIFDKHFEMPLMDIEYDLMEIPFIDHQAEFSLASGTFATIINQLRVFGEVFTINCTEENITFNASSQDQGKMTTNIPIDDLEEYAIEEGQELNTVFSLKYLHDVCLYQKIAKNISVGISSNYPMKLMYHLAPDIEDKRAEMAFYIAPRMED